jgi:hypothetical protein
VCVCVCVCVLMHGVCVRVIAAQYAMKSDYVLTPSAMLILVKLGVVNWWGFRHITPTEGGMDGMGEKHRSSYLKNQEAPKIFMVSEAVQGLARQRKDNKVLRIQEAKYVQHDLISEARELT